MNVLILGSGGREHAIAWKLKQSTQVEELYCAPGNGGTAQVAMNVDILVDDTKAIIKFSKENDIGFVVVGPEAPLVNGIVDALEEAGIAAFGPKAGAALLEGSKIYAKEFMGRWDIPTASFRVFEEINEAKSYLQTIDMPVVIKADGLAAGKGVYICTDREEAIVAVDQIMQDKIFKEAGNQIVIEECLEGEEASILAVSDGEDFVILDSSQDHKRIFDDDLGPNTGGMGAYSPAPVIDDQVLKIIEKQVIEPTIRGMRTEGDPFKGILYAGIMMTKDGPKVLEFNVRFGDPEIQAVLPRLKNDLLELMYASYEGRLNDTALVWDKRSCVSVVLSAGGYPGEYKKGDEITGLDEAEKTNEAVVFHAGTKEIKGKVVTSGGRVLAVTALGDDIHEAIIKAYEAVDKVKFKSCFFRRDIGAKALGHIELTRRG
ncbi:MAG: phosphoribosylamine--glycine ligase [Lysobacterales bacterium]|jgi:phosphoribosylamine--glycine ligase